jgi:hypothetical protein
VCHSIRVIRRLAYYTNVLVAKYTLCGVEHSRSISIAPLGSPLFFCLSSLVWTYGLSIALPLTSASSPLWSSSGAVILAHLRLCARRVPLLTPLFPTHIPRLPASRELAQNVANTNIS